MIRMYKDLRDPLLTYVVCSDTHNGAWCASTTEAIEEYQKNLNKGYGGDDPHLQVEIVVIAEAETINELRMEILLNE